MEHTFLKSLSIMITVIPEKRDALKSIYTEKSKISDHYQTNNKAEKEELQTLKLIFASFILLTAFSSFIALLIMM